MAYFDDLPDKQPTPYMMRHIRKMIADIEAVNGIQFGDLSWRMIMRHAAAIEDALDPDNWKVTRTDWPEGQESQFLDASDIEKLHKRLSPDAFRRLYLNEWIPPEDRAE